VHLAPETLCLWLSARATSATIMRMCLQGGRNIEKLLSSLIGALLMAF